LTDCPNYYRDMLSYVCGGAALVGVLATLTLVPRTRQTEPSDYSRLQDDAEEVPDEDANHSIQSQ
jgi:hypothetical protein